MPGFCFSPTMINQKITLILKSGHQISGEAVDANPAEVILKNLDNPERLIRINRDEVIGFTGFDDYKRSPDNVRLTLSRCLNRMTRCNGVKKIDIDPISKRILENECPAYNPDCEIMSCDMFDMKKESLVKLLKNIQVNKYPEKIGEKKNEK